MHCYFFFSCWWSHISSSLSWTDFLDFHFCEDASKSWPLTFLSVHSDRAFHQDRRDDRYACRQLSRTVSS